MAGLLPFIAELELVTQSNNRYSDFRKSIEPTSETRLYITACGRTPEPQPKALLHSAHHHRFGYTHTRPMHRPPKIVT